LKCPVFADGGTTHPKRKHRRHNGAACVEA